MRVKFILRKKREENGFLDKKANFASVFCAALSFSFCNFKTRSDSRFNSLPIWEVETPKVVARRDWNLFLGIFFLLGMILSTFVDFTRTFPFLSLRKWIVKNYRACRCARRRNFTNFTRTRRSRVLNYPR